MKNPSLQKNLYICLMGLQMAGIFSKTAAPHALFYLTPEQIRKLRAEMDSHPRFAIEPLLDIFFECIPSKTLHAIYDQLKNSMAWGVCLEPYFVREKDRLSQTKKAAQKTASSAKTAARKTGSETKTAARKTGSAVKTAAKKTGTATKTAAKKSASAAKTAAKKSTAAAKKAANS